MIFFRTYMWNRISSDVEEINGLDNLQPLMYNENISKGGKYEPIQFENWLFSKNIDSKGSQMTQIFTKGGQSQVEIVGFEHLHLH